MTDSASAENQESLGLLSHLIELRDRLLRSVIVIGVLFVVLFPFAKRIYDWLAAPLVSQGQEMIIVGPVAPFLIPMKLTLLVAFLLALPYVFYQVWAFVAPGLYKHEKRLIYPLIASSIFLFYLGIAFVYYLLLPMMFQIIPQFAPSVAVFSPDIGQYLDFTMMMFMAFGIGFEMPIATILLVSTGVTTAEDLKRKRPYVVVGAFVIGMLLTPPDVISQVMLAIPMWLLFEVGLFFSKFFKARMQEASDARQKMDEAEQQSDTSKTVAAGAATTSTVEPTLSAQSLWEDDDYHYQEQPEDNTIHNEYQDSDSFDLEPSDSANHTVTEDNSDAAIDADDDDYKELSDEEMEAELDQIEADELAEEQENDKNSKKTLN